MATIKTLTAKGCNNRIKLACILIQDSIAFYNDSDYRITLNNNIIYIESLTATKAFCSVDNFINIARGCRLNYFFFSNSIGNTVLTIF